MGCGLSGSQIGGGYARGRSGRCGDSPKAAQSRDRAQFANLQSLISLIMYKSITNTEYNFLEHRSRISSALLDSLKSRVNRIIEFKKSLLMFIDHCLEDVQYS